MTRRVLLDRDLTHAWLDAALNLATSATPLEQARITLTERLECEPLGEEARSKTVTALTRTWLNPDPSVRRILDWAIAHSVEQLDSRPLHIGALLVTQPFFADQAAVVGRILTVQDDVDTRTVRARMRALWGPRRAVDVAVQRTIKTMRSLGMLQGTAGESLSRKAPQINVRTPVTGGWLAACLLQARDADSISTTEFFHAPELVYLHLPTQLELVESGLQRFSEGAGRSVLSARAPARQP